MAGKTRLDISLTIISIIYFVSIALFPVFIISAKYWDNDPTMGGFATGVILGFWVFPLFGLCTLLIWILGIVKYFRKQEFSTYQKALIWLTIILPIISLLIAYITGIGF